MMPQEQGSEPAADVKPLPPPTFQGQLQLESFKYSAPAAPPPLPRRSPRRIAARTTTASRARSSSAAKAKRRKCEGSSPPGLPQQVSSARPAAGYAPPSTYAHLPLLPDAVAPGLLVLFVGLNPGIQTARTGHAYAHPSNLFWKLLFSSGITPRPCRADEDRLMPALYSLGLTNIVARPSRNAAELSRAEMDAGVALLEEKARRWRPEAMCIVGKGIWESIWRVRRCCPVGRHFRYGWQDETENMGVINGEWPGARVFVATSTSGLAASLSPAEKQVIWAELGSWVKARRAERDQREEKEPDP